MSINNNVFILIIYYHMLIIQIIIYNLLTFNAYNFLYIKIFLKIKYI
jgi:hypothetical protein